MKSITRDVDTQRVDESIEQLEIYVKDASIEPFMAVLEALKQDPNNQSLLTRLTTTFLDLGIIQGAVLTYAPYINYLLSDDPFAEKE